MTNPIAYYILFIPRPDYARPPLQSVEQIRANEDGGKNESSYFSRRRGNQITPTHQ